MLTINALFFSYFTSMSASATQLPNTDLGYCADVTPLKAHEWLHNQLAVLVDVRTAAELHWVGFVPGAIHIEWKTWPDMASNANFEQLLLQKVQKNTKVLFLCRSGARSQAAAKLATQLGYSAYNIATGFEGDSNELGQRSQMNGWRFCNLPWQQS
jgi:sulfur dioxygenase